MPRGKAAATPINPHIQKWQEANGEVKLAMDKRKGEQGLKGLQAAREYFCNGVKITTALLNDPSFPEKELDSWENWCDTDALTHLPIWDRDATAGALRVLLEAILEIGIKPHFLPPAGSASGENAHREEEVQNLEGLERAVRAIIAITPIILDGHNPQLQRRNPVELEMLKASPYLSQQWLETCISILEYLDRKGYQSYVGVNVVATILQNISGDDLYCRTKVWGNDAASNDLRVRMGRLILDSKTTGMSLHGLRAIVYSTSGIDHGSSSREDALSAIFKDHPGFRKASQTLRLHVSTGLASAGTEYIQKPRIYMYVINVLHALRPLDRPRGAPIRSFHVAGKDAIVNVKSKGRLQKGEIIVYLDAFGIHVNTFDDFGYEDPMTMPYERMRDCRRLQDPPQNRFIWVMKPDKENPVEKEIILEVEEGYVDRFEAGLKHWLPAKAWLPRAGDAPPRETAVLVPETSGASEGSIARNSGQGTTSTGESLIPNTTEESGTGQASHASDSHPSYVLPPKSSKQAETRPSSRPPGTDKESNKSQDVTIKQPRRSARARMDDGSLESDLSATEEVQPQAAPEAGAKDKGKGRGKGKQFDDSTGTSSANPEKSIQPLEATESSYSPVRPSRTAKSRAMAKTTEVLDEEAVPLNETIIVSPKKPAERKFGEGLETQGEIAGVSTQSVREMAVVEEVVEGVDEPADEEESSAKGRPKSKSAPPTKTSVGRGKGKGKAAVEVPANGDNGGATTRSLPANVELEEPLEEPEPTAPAKRTTKPRLGKRLYAAKTDRPVYQEGAAGPSKATGNEEPVGETCLDAAGDVCGDETEDGVQGDLLAETREKKGDGKKPSEVITPDLRAPVASQQVPITKPNAISRSGKKYTREKPASKRQSASSDSDDDDEAEGPLNPDNKSKSKDSSPDVEPPPKAKATARPSRAKVVLQPKQPKETLASQIKVGQAMTPAKAAEAKAESARKIAAEKKAEEKKKAAERKAEEKRLADMRKAEEWNLAENKKKAEEEKAEKEAEEARVAEEEERAKKEEEERRRAEKMEAAEKKKAEKKETEERKKAEKQAKEEKRKKAEEERRQVEAEEQAEREEQEKLEARRREKKRKEDEKRVAEEQEAKAAADMKASEAARRAKEVELAVATKDKQREKTTKGKNGPPKANAIQRSLTAPNPIADTDTNSGDDENPRKHQGDQILVQATQDEESDLEDAFGIVSHKVPDSGGLSDEGDGGAGLLLEEMEPLKKKGRQANIRPARSGTIDGEKVNKTADKSAPSVETKPRTRISPQHQDEFDPTAAPAKRARVNNTVTDTERSTVTKRKNRKIDAVVETDNDEDGEDGSEVDEEVIQEDKQGKGKGKGSKVVEEVEEDNEPSVPSGKVDRAPARPPSKQAALKGIPPSSPLKSALKRASPANLAGPLVTLASDASASQALANRPVLPVHRSNTTGNLPRAVAFSDPIEAGRSNDIQLAANVPVQPKAAGRPAAAVVSVPVVAMLAPVDTNADISRRDKTTIEAARLNDVAVEPPAKRRSPARNLEIEDSPDHIRPTSELPSRPRRSSSRNPHESAKPSVEVDTICTKQIRAEDHEDITYETLSPKRKRKVSVNEPVIERKARKIRSASTRGGRRDKARQQMEESIYGTIDEIAQVVKDRVRDRLERPKRTAAAIKRHVTKVACKLVDDFGIDHDAIYQDLNKQAMTIYDQQNDLQKLAKEQVQASKFHTREIRDIIKLYKNPMEGIPTTLFA